MRGNTRRCQAENPLIALSSFLEPALSATSGSRMRRLFICRVHRRVAPAPVFPHRTHGTPCRERPLSLPLAGLSLHLVLTADCYSSFAQICSVHARIE